jgi:DMSO/TMAO reductase YedYZ heme-binding membrane subunit
MSQVLTVFCEMFSFLFLSVSMFWILQAYEKGLMIAVIPFTSKVMFPCALFLSVTCICQLRNEWRQGAAIFIYCP